MFDPARDLSSLTAPEPLAADDLCRLCEAAGAQAAQALTLQVAHLTERVQELTRQRDHYRLGVPRAIGAALAQIDVLRVIARHPSDSARDRADIEERLRQLAVVLDGVYVAGERSAMTTPSVRGGR